MLRPKHHSLTVRLTQEEYDLLVEQSAATGARSISDHARITLFNKTDGQDVCVRLTAVEGDVRRLAHEIRVLREHIAVRHRDPSPSEESV